MIALREACVEVELFDLRDRQKAKLRRSRVRGGKTVERDPRTVNAITVHQTATLLPPGRFYLARAHRDARLAQALRCMKIPAHAIALRNRSFVVHAKLEHHLWHGGPFNEDSLGLEIEGLYRGDESDPRKRRGTKRFNRLDADTLDASRAALTWLVEQGRELGMPLQYIDAHRQGARSRAADPGEAIWREVVVEHGVKRLGLQMRPDDTRADGLVIPAWWGGLA